MSRVRRHYRVAKKEVEQSPQKGAFVNHEDKHKILVCGLLAFLLAFLNGFLIGYLLGRNENE